MTKVQRIAVIGFRPPILSFARRCRDLGVSVHLIDVLNQAGALRRFPSWIQTDGQAMSWSEIGTDKGIERILQLVLSSRADGLISADEGTLCWLARSRALFEPRCRVMAPPAGILEGLLCKKEQVKTARAAGFNVLNTWYLEGTSDSTEIPEAQFPICVRPTYPDSVRPAFKMKVFANPGELACWMESLQSIRRPLVAQPFRLGPNVIVHGARDLTGKILTLAAYRTVRKFLGFAQSLERFALDRELSDCCGRFAETAGLVGTFHFDLLESDADRRTYFLEINPRMGGTTGKVVGLGYDEPALTLEAFGMKTPRHTELAASRSRVTSKRSLMKQIVQTATAKKLCEFRYPLYSRPSTLLRSALEFALVADPSLSMGDWEGSFRYLFCPETD